MKFMTTLSVTTEGILLAGLSLEQSYGMGPDLMGGNGGAYDKGKGGMQGNADSAFGSLNFSPEQRRKIYGVLTKDQRVQLAQHGSQR